MCVNGIYWKKYLDKHHGIAFDALTEFKEKSH